MARGGITFRRSARARDVVARAGRPGLTRAGRAIARAIPGQVPVQSGVAQSTYRPRVVDEGDEVHVAGFGPFWHLLEYGTPFSPIYRPIQRGVQAAGLRYEAH